MLCNNHLLTHPSSMLINPLQVATFSRSSLCFSAHRSQPGMLTDPHHQLSTQSSNLPSRNADQNVWNSRESQCQKHKRGKKLSRILCRCMTLFYDILLNLSPINFDSVYKWHTAILGPVELLFPWSLHHTSLEQVSSEFFLKMSRAIRVTPGQK